MKGWLSASTLGLSGRGPPLPDPLRKCCWETAPQVKLLALYAGESCLRVLTSVLEAGGSLTQVQLSVRGQGFSQATVWASQRQSTDRPSSSVLSPFILRTSARFHPPEGPFPPHI